MAQVGDPHLTMKDGLSHLTGEVGSIVKNISITSSNLENTLNGLYDLYGKAINERVQLLKDIDVIIQDNEQAKKALQLAEDGKVTAETLKQEAIDAQQRAEAEKNALRSQFGQLQQEKSLALQQHEQLQGQHQQLKGQHQQLQGQHQELQGQHQGLQALQQSQIATIQTHIDTINQLRTEIQKLEQYLSKLNSQSTAYDCIKLYEKYPLLIKLKRNFDQVQITVTQQITFQSLQTFSSAYFQMQFTELNSIRRSIDLIIKQVYTNRGQQPSQHWTESIKRIDGIQKIINDTVVGSITWGQYIYYKWLLEKNSNIQVDAELKKSMDTIASGLRDNSIQIP